MVGHPSIAPELKELEGRLQGILQAFKILITYIIVDN